MKYWQRFLGVLVEKGMRIMNQNRSRDKGRKVEVLVFWSYLHLEGEGGRFIMRKAQKEKRDEVINFVNEFFKHPYGGNKGV